ncbi:MAG: NUDIX hydrolase [Candidatus Hydrogenedentes bacterium]|nr:NUDIX hydrolase [Candidatus Hydrogenedentota bacterium]
MEKKLYTYEFPRPSVTVDALVFRRREGGEWEILLIKRKYEPFAGFWALPGGFIEDDETLEEAVERELYEETSLKEVQLTQLRAFSKPNRDPRGRTISIAFVGVLTQDVSLQPRSDAKEIGWFPIADLPNLAFDHDEIIKCGIEWLGTRK